MMLDPRVCQVFLDFERRFRKTVEDLDCTEEQRNDIRLDAK